MTPFQDRAKRLDLSFPLEFTDDSGTVAGHCLNLSESGVLANFDTALDLWVRGELLIHFGSDLCTVQARVARVQGQEAGLTFLYQAESERIAVRRMLAFAATESHLPHHRPF